ncbi:glycosyltransferase family 2 protein [Crossiella cryophila]|uniref:Glycosyltransferase involved in cell wall biosynthesis n=1 Tax=Crossiella cryophila TaxID=43355 RepID=A0A7W7CEZ1_9PSEU|nr:glycosyltransferase [Crossiella cryophila]MBB4679757.1 glycosyltransferase involved in cell wall biosynthesis [Crossiella cryophila]
MISVVIPTRDRTTRLYLTLSALLAQTLDRAGFEVVLVDDSPTPGAVEAVLAALPAGLPLRRTATGGRGVAAARNAGAALATGDLLLFLDDDTLAAPDLLRRHVIAHGPATVAHGRITDLTAFLFTPDPPRLSETLTGARGRTLGPADLPALAQRYRRLGPQRSFIEGVAQAVAGIPAYHELRWLACVGTSTSMPRELFNRMGGFDEGFGALWGGEDLELGLRLALAGAEFRLIGSFACHLPQARHHTATDLGLFWTLVAQRHGRPRLVRVGDFLRGRISLDQLAAELAPARQATP